MKFFDGSLDFGGISASFPFFRPTKNEDGFRRGEMGRGGTRPYQFHRISTV